MSMRGLVALAALAVLLGGCEPDRAAQEREARTLVFEKLSQPDLPVVVGPAVMQEDFAVVDWTRGAFGGGRTLLRRDKAGWTMILCGGAPLKSRPVLAFNHHRHPESAGWADAGGRPGLSFAEARTNPDINLYDAVAQKLRPELASGRRVLLTASSAGAIERLSGLLKDHGLPTPRPVEHADDLAGLESGVVARSVLNFPTGFSADDLLVVTEQDILGDRMTRAISRKKKSETFLAELEGRIGSEPAELAERTRSAMPPEQVWMGLERYWRTH